MNLTRLLRFKSVFATIFVIGFSLLVFSVVIDEVRKSQDIRSRASGSRIIRDAFCEGKEMCSDDHCVGETWRECEPCPSGKSRAVYRISCQQDSYSECELDDSVCDDR